MQKLIACLTLVPLVISCANPAPTKPRVVLSYSVQTKDYKGIHGPVRVTYSGANAMEDCERAQMDLIVISAQDDAPRFYGTRCDIR